VRKLIWTCNAGSCGGYADRLKGIVTAYLMAQAVGREFFIEWGGVTKLSDAFAVPCAPAPESLCYPNAPVIRLIDNLTTEDQLIAAISTLADIKAAVVRIAVNQYEPIWTALETDAGTFARVLNLLMTPRDTITGHPAYLAAAEFVNSHNTVGVQVRTGEYHNEPGARRVEPAEVWRRLLQDSVEGVFIASDSPKWKDDFRAAHPTPAAPTFQFCFAPAHIERSAPDAIRNTFLLTVIEHQILSKCSAVYTGWGGFGRTAAWWGGKPCIDLLSPPAQSGAKS
jgi:hypothetical protein